MYKFREKSHFIIIVSVVISCLCRRVSLSPAIVFTVANRRCFYEHDINVTAVSVVYDVIR